MSISELSALSMNSSLIESLLYQSEGTALDFKSAQYPFIGCEDQVKKSELLKDVLAFANSWRQSDAYIVIGVKAIEGGRHIPVGTDEHFDDAQLQQFINSKTNRKIAFAYEVHLYEGLKIGIIRIPQQERPSYIKKTYGKVEKNIVYYRLGSSTEIATPEDIARMGREEIETKSIPKINLQFADHKTCKPLGSDTTLSCSFHPETSELLPDFKICNTSSYGNISIPIPVTDLPNEDYWRELEDFVRLHRLLQPLTFLIHNQSGILAENVRLEVTGTSVNGVTIQDKSPSEPPQTQIEVISRNITPFRALLGKSPPNTTVKYRGKTWTLEVEFGSIQPQASCWSEQPFYIGSYQQAKLEMEAIIYADNLPEPQRIPLAIDFNISIRDPLTIESLTVISKQIKFGMWE